MNRRVLFASCIACAALMGVVRSADAAVVACPPSVHINSVAGTPAGWKSSADFNLQFTGAQISEVIGPMMIRLQCAYANNVLLSRDVAKGSCVLSADKKGFECK